jgi:putative ABC transport system substrate-binding protein
MEAITELAQQAAQNKGVPLHVERAGSVSEIEGAFTSLGQLRPGALVVGINPFFASHRVQIATLALANSIPSIFHSRTYALAGGLLSYGPDFPVLHRQMGVYAGKILNGARPADLPVEQPTKFELVINLKTAKALGLTIPPSLLARADEVIE